MTLIITKSINPDDQQELFAGLRQYNQQYLDAAQFGDLGVYSRDGQVVMQGGLIAKRNRPQKTSVVKLKRRVLPSDPNDLLRSISVARLLPANAPDLSGC